MSISARYMYRKTNGANLKRVKFVRIQTYKFAVRTLFPAHIKCNTAAYVPSVGTWEIVSKVIVAGSNSKHPFIFDLKR